MSGGERKKSSRLARITVQPEPEHQLPTRAPITVDHQQIRQWAEQRGGRPAMVVLPDTGEETGEIRIMFPTEETEETRREISWDDFFGYFDQDGLAFHFEERTPTGELSRFYRFVDREEARAATKPVTQKPTRAAGRRTMRVMARAEGRSTVTTGKAQTRKSKKTARTVEQGSRPRKKKIRKRAV